MRDPQESATSFSPSERIHKTVAVISSGDVAEVLNHTRNTLPAKLTFSVPNVMDELHTVGYVCTFFRRLHDAIPDLKLALEQINVDEKAFGAISWRATCSGTQVKKFIPNLPIDAPATFTLEVTERLSNNKPTWMQWDFSVPEISLESQETEFSAMELLHRKGECQPCAYFAFRADGCRQGSNCEFCHLCTKSQAKAKKKVKSARMKAVVDQDK
jgi:hypothetical protein